MTIEINIFNFIIGLIYTISILIWIGYLSNDFKNIWKEFNQFDELWNEEWSWLFAYRPGRFFKKLIISIILTILFPTILFFIVIIWFILLPFIIFYNIGKVMKKINDISDDLKKLQ